MRTVSGLCLLLALLVACGDEATTIDSGAPEPTTTTTSTTTEWQDGDDGDDGDNGDGGDDEAETLDCDEDDDSPRVIGRGHTVEITGECDDVLVTGGRHAVTIESADRVEVSGIDNNVRIGDANEVTVSGGGHDVRYPESATLDDDGCLRCDVESE